MDHGAEFIEYLPQLRRYARALTGSQDTGDQLVIAVLRRLGQKRHASGNHPKVVLFEILSTLWNGLIGEQLRSTFVNRDISKAVDERLGALKQLSRQAFLLVTLDEFTHKEAAQILQVSPAEFEGILHKARAEVAAMVATDILIIEDEYLIAADLKRIMLELGHSVLDIAPTHREALAVIKDKKPGLIIADIKLADGSNGIDAVNEILLEHSVPVVFITGYPEGLIMAHRPQPSFLISKPFESDAIRAVVSQASFFNDRAIAPAGTVAGH